MEGAVSFLCQKRRLDACDMVQHTDHLVMFPKLPIAGAAMGMCNGTHIHSSSTKLAALFAG